ncbi:hypothetical protein PHLGIDRAFT_63938 [Phlebiopsis gigantea 11061_1 CR5-6]|uniref:Natural resistance-associated macrophage protein n=1 Tax=Phlebiopsis gigantea (strain 11061_1 CR5-6) TaxID=745531 RepID=A0A0C3P100_PHLG1|nr:hypothetical protein PHLGIDRAFT_63938 [Phlebiopsis gigantea 11061_1 CR5-6]
MHPLARQTSTNGDQETNSIPQDGENQSRLVRSARAVLRHVKHHVGVGIICSVAYFDPGNWSVDLQAGSEFGYRPLLFVVMLAGLGAIVLQSLASKLGVVTGADLATHCRLLLHDRPKHRRLIRYTVLYPLYALSEIAIISTDLAELLGSAIGLCLLFPALPLWAGVLVTAGDVLIFLVLNGPSRYGKPAKLFELSIIVLVFAVFACFVVLLVKVHPDWGNAFLGFIPDKELFDGHGNILYTAVGILGATVMPHALFLGSFLATQDRTGEHMPAPLPSPRENNELRFIQAHLKHGIVDVVASLLGLAVPINAAILIVAAAVFFRDGAGSMVPAGLFDAYNLIVQHVGKAAGIIFALALLSSGQSSSITATLAGQVVSEGFIEWRISPFLRRLITRLIGLVPSMAVAIAVGKPGINTLLVASQVALSIVLPFVAFPLIWLTSSKSIMRVRKPNHQREKPQQASSEQVHEEVSTGAPHEEDELIDFSNGPLLTAAASLIFVIVLAANMYVIIILALGRA